MRFQIVSIGRERADSTAPLVADYASRINKFIPLELRVLRADRADRVAAQLRDIENKSDVAVALDERGVTYTSAAFSDVMASWMNRGLSLVSFLIGGADGFPATVKENADLLFSLSRLTLPHRLARLLLVEQLYRALCRMRNVPYQK